MISTKIMAGCESAIFASASNPSIAVMTSHPALDSKVSAVRRIVHNRVGQMERGPAARGKQHQLFASLEHHALLSLGGRAEVSKVVSKVSEIPQPARGLAAGLGRSVWRSQFRRDGKEVAGVHQAVGTT